MENAVSSYSIVNHTNLYSILVFLVQNNYQKYEKDAIQMNYTPTIDTEEISAHKKGAVKELLKIQISSSGLYAFFWDKLHLLD